MLQGMACQQWKTWQAQHQRNTGERIAAMAPCRPGPHAKHRNINVGPWSGMSMHPVEHIGFLSPVLIHLLLSAHPLHILFMMQHPSLRASTSHAGYEKRLLDEQAGLAPDPFPHQMHHRYFEVNRGTLEMSWDKGFGTFHDGTIAAHERLKGRRGRQGG